MEIADTFIPTAGAVGLLPMVTYFFLIVATFVFTSLFVFSLIALFITGSAPTRLISRLPLMFIPILAVVSAGSYYVLQSFYHNVLAELVTTTDATDRQTLLREAYHSLSQYRYIAWFINTPILLIQVVCLLPVQLWRDRRSLVKLLAGNLIVVFFSFIGHQQLSFDNEVQAGPMAIWGLLALAGFGFTAFTLNRLQKVHNGFDQPGFRWASLTLGTVWIVYFVGYFLALTTIDVNVLQLGLTFVDIVSVIGISKIILLIHTNRWPNTL